MPSADEHAPAPDFSPQERVLAGLLAAAAQRDDVAFAELYRLTSGKLYALARRIVGVPRASDVLQEAYVRIWAHAARFDPARGRPMHWMAAITRNLALTSIRPAIVPTVDWEDLEIPVLASLDSAYDLSRCLATLGARERDCVELAFLHGYSHTELEDRLGMKLGTLKSTIRRALLRLRACLESEPVVAEQDV